MKLYLQNIFFTALLVYDYFGIRNFELKADSSQNFEYMKKLVFQTKIMSLGGERGFGLNRQMSQ